MAEDYCVDYFNNLLVIINYLTKVLEKFEILIL